MELLAKQQDWLYEVGLLQAEDAYAPNLNSVPESWFKEAPEWKDEVDQYSLQVSDREHDKGRVYGLIANFGACYLNFNNQCWTAPQIKQEEEYVYQGNVRSREGNLVPVNILAATKGHHFSDSQIENVLANQGFLDDQFSPLSQSYDVMAHQLAYGRYINTPEGIAFCGALFPHVGASMVNRINASAVSGHWQKDLTDNQIHFLGAVFVNRGALPLRSRSNIELTKIAASLGYNHFMAQSEQTCSCKKENIIAATDPNVQTADRGNDEVSPELSLGDLALTVNEHSSEIEKLTQALIEVIKNQDRLAEAVDGTM